jgi:hypothetical protein
VWRQADQIAFGMPPARIVVGQVGAVLEQARRGNL